MSNLLTRDYINELRSIIENRDNSAALDKLEHLHPADIAEMYENLSLEEITYLVLLLEPEKASDVLVELEEDEERELIGRLSLVSGRRRIHVGDFLAPDERKTLARARTLRTR